MKKTLKYILTILLALIAVPVLILGYFTITDYKPALTKKLEIRGTAGNTAIPDTFSVVTWNIGYCGLGKEQDFFFDGGQNVRPTRELYDTYESGMLRTVSGFSNHDFILLQEVDVSSRRSYKHNQVTLISGQQKDFQSTFAYNYRSQFVPQPISNPYGKAFGGILTLSRYPLKESVRHRLAEDAAWPVGLFMLKRCFTANRLDLPQGKQLVIVNLHLSAYDDGTVKQRQMNDLAKFLLAEYEAGNYVLAGGDWNQFPPGYVLEKKGKIGVAEISVPDNYPAPGWHWVSDLSVPSNRSLERPFDALTSQTLILDYFLASPNIEVLSVQGMDAGFAFSDHNPVEARFRLIR